MEACERKELDQMEKDLRRCPDDTGFAIDAKHLEWSDHKPFITVKSEDGTEHTYYSIFCEDLPEEMLRKAREEVNETEENKREGMKKLREYMKKEKMPDVDDVYVIATLRCSKYDIKKAKVKLAKFIKLYKILIARLPKYHPDEVGALLNHKGIGLFPYRDRKGRIIVFVRPFEEIFSYDLELVESGFAAAIIYGLTLPHASLLGTSLIFPSQLPEKRHFYPIVRVFINMLPHVVHLPHRVASVKILNDHIVGRLIYRIVRPFLPDKINKRISFLTKGFEELHKDLPPEILPEEYGGYMGPLNVKVYHQDVIARLKYELRNANCL